MPTVRRLLVIWLSFACLLFGSQAFATPRVATSIKPIGDLVAAVMVGVGTPSVLIPPGSSPHTYAFKPSERMAAEKAQVLFWIGPDVESALPKITQAMPASARIVALSTLPGIALLPARTGGDWERKRPPQSAGHDDHDHRGGFDGHLWLSPANAKVILRATAQTLSAVDPAHAALYRANADSAVRRIDRLEAQIKAELAPVKDKPFIVFHDAFQYFEHAFGLRAVGSILVSPDALANAGRVSEMRDKIRNKGVVCVFSEPQFEPRLVQTLTEGSNARLGTLDPLGAKGPTGLDGYEVLLRNLSNNLVRCLSGKT